MKKSREPKLDTAEKKPALGHNPFASLAHLASELPPGTAPEAPPHPVAKAPRASTGKLVLRRETKHRAGRSVLVVAGLDSVSGLTQQGMRQLAQELKVALGVGGTFEESSEGGPRIVIQGDDAARLTQLLVARGYRVTGTVR